MHTHIVALLLQAGEAASKLSPDHFSIGLLIYQQIQLSQMKVKVNALWEKFLGEKEQPETEQDETLES